MLRDLRVVIEDLVDDFALGKDAHVACDPVHLGGDIGDGAVIALVCRHQGGFDRVEDDLAVQSFVGCHLIDTSNQLLWTLFPLTTTKAGETPLSPEPN